MTFSAEGGNFFSAYKVRSKNDGFLGPYSPFLVGGSGLSFRGGSKLLQGGGSLRDPSGGAGPPSVLTYAHVLMDFLKVPIARVKCHTVFASNL